MGSYCISCVASGQVISERVRCAMLPILRSRSYSQVTLTDNEGTRKDYGPSRDTTHPGGIWAPFAPFVRGTYVDYGRMEPSDTLTNRQALVYLFQELARTSPVVETEDSSADRGRFDFKAFLDKSTPLLKSLLEQRPPDDEVLQALSFKELLDAWDYVAEGTREGQVFARKYDGPLVPVQFASFHHAAFDHLRDLGIEKESYSGRSWALEDLLPRELTELMNEDRNSENPSSEFQRFFRQTQVLDSLNLGLSYDVHELRLAYRPAQQKLVEQFVDGKLSLGKVVEALMPSMAGVYVMKAMDDLNLRLAPSSYAGQDYDNEVGRAYAKFVSAVSKAATKELKALYL